MIHLQKEQWVLVNGEPGTFQNEFSKKVWMILGEGGVFFSLLALGIWKVHTNLKREAALINQERNFLMAITHELKTPIAAVSLILQTLQREGVDRDDQLEIIHQGLSEVKRLDALTENILFATRLEHGDGGFHKSLTDVSELSSRIANKLQLTLGIDRQIHTDITPEIMASVDHRAFESLLVNLLENALKYSPTDQAVALTLWQDAGQLRLKVCDGGIGISDAERRKVFQKFYRVGSEDTRKAKGTGLGLYIVQQVVEGHKGHIKIIENHPQGTCFEVSLPLGNE